MQAAHHAATAAQLGGGALVEQCDKLQADLLNCQQALLDKEAESLEKEKRLAEMAARWVLQQLAPPHAAPAGCWMGCWVGCALLSSFPAAEGGPCRPAGWPSWSALPACTTHVTSACRQTICRERTPLSSSPPSRYATAQASGRFYPAQRSTEYLPAAASGAC